MCLPPFQLDIWNHPRCIYCWLLHPLICHNYFISDWSECVLQQMECAVPRLRSLCTSRGAVLIGAFSALIVLSVVNRCLLVSPGLCWQIILVVSLFHLGLSVAACDWLWRLGCASRRTAGFIPRTWRLLLPATMIGRHQRCCLCLCVHLTAC